MNILLYLVQQYSRDDSAVNEESMTIKCESSPPTPRSLRLDRVATAIAQASNPTNDDSTLSSIPK